MNYDKPDKEKTINILKWLIEDVRSMGGDGDATWYSKYYDINDIHEIIMESGILPNYWETRHYPERRVRTYGGNQEWLIISNNEDSYKKAPSWTQTLLVH